MVFGIIKQEAKEIREKYLFLYSKTEYTAWVKLRRLNKEIAEEFTGIIREIPEVTECYNISGSYDYLLKIHAPDMKYYQEFLLNVLGTIESLGSMESTFVMDEVKQVYGIQV